MPPTPWRSVAWSAKVDWEKTRVALDDKLVKYEYFDLRSLSSFQRHDTTQPEAMAASLLEVLSHYGQLALWCSIIILIAVSLSLPLNEPMLTYPELCLWRTEDSVQHLAIPSTRKVPRSTAMESLSSSCFIPSCIWRSLPAHCSNP